MEALYWKQLHKENLSVQCFLCPHNCKILEGNTGLCRTRLNKGGKLYSLSYEKFTSIALDPIEKKPLYHFYPGTSILSLGNFGCNFFCPWCQNYEISQSDGSQVQKEIKISNLITLAQKNNSIGIAYTYNEPLINYEFLLHCSKKAKEFNLKNILVTNGYINEAPLQELLPTIDAANIDIKSFHNHFYLKYCKGQLPPVLKTIETFFENNKHIELTYLVIPELNDQKEEIQNLTDWIYSISPEIPLHFSRYYPSFKFQKKSTPLKTLQSLRDIALKKLLYVYLGNVWEEKDNHSSCPYCKNILIQRSGYQTKIINLEGNHCKNCGKQIYFQS